MFQYLKRYSVLTLPGNSWSDEAFVIFKVRSCTFYFLVSMKLFPVATTNHIEFGRAPIFIFSPDFFSWFVKKKKKSPSQSLKRKKQTVEM